MRLSLALFFSTALISVNSQALQVDWEDDESIKAATGEVALGMTSYYTGYRPGDVPGNVPDPYHWWHAGAMFGALIDYYHYTGDDQFNQITTQGLLHQIGPERNYMPPNQSKSLGNDDQGFWGMTVMSAAENRYPDSTNEDDPSWLSLAQAVFNTQYPRWDDERCGGGLRWQIFSLNQGYNYKNTISVGCFFNIAARLGRYTGNESYVEWAERAWDWTRTIGLMTDDYHFYDGTDRVNNCSDWNHDQWTYNAGVFLYGASALWNHTTEETGDENNKWRARLEGIISGLSFFLVGDSNVIAEKMCEDNLLPGGNGFHCNIDQRSFKAYLSRWMHSTMQVAPWTAERLLPILDASRRAAAQTCVADGDGIMRCGLRWTDNAFDGSTGIGENMAALEVMLSALTHNSPGPVTDKTGGTSKSDPTAGQGTGSTDSDGGPVVFAPITTADRAGAAILTVVVLCVLLSGAAWMIVAESLSDDKDWVSGKGVI